MNRQIRLAVLGTALFVFVACAEKVVTVIPPKLDLTGYGSIGVIEFSSSKHPELCELATQRFLQAMQSAQTGVPVLELGDERHVLEAVGHDEWNFEAVRAIGEKFHINSLLVGKLDVTEIKPKIRLSTSLNALRVKAQIEASLSVKLHSTDSGATRWTKSAHGAKTVAQVSLLKRGKPRVNVGDPDGAHASLVSWLVDQVTDDLRPHYAKR